MDAVSVPEGKKLIQDAAYDLYLVSPQTKMNYQQLADEDAKLVKEEQGAA